MSSGAIATTLLAAALLPGAFFQWGFERNAGRFGIALKDRLLRTTGISAIFLALFAWPIHRLYANYWPQAASGDHLPIATYFVPVVYLAIPLFLGWLCGLTLKKDWDWVKGVAGRKRFPTAWDYAFSDMKSGWIRCKLKSGEWVGGLYSSMDSTGHTSYASGYPEPHELYLYPIVEMDQESGHFKIKEAGEAIFGVGGLLLRWEEIDMLNFVASDFQEGSNEKQS